MDADQINDPRNAEDYRHLQQIGPQRAIALVFKWLAGDDQRLYSFAVAVMRELGSEALSGLVQEALKPRQREQTKIRLLRSIAEIGLPLSRDDQEHIMMTMGLAGLAFIRHATTVFAEIREAEGHNHISLTGAAAEASHPLRPS